MSRSPADLSAEVRALRLLAAVEWKSSGRQLVTNLQFGPEALEVFIRDLGKIAAEALDARFLNGDIYVNAGQAEKLFKLEGLALNVRRNELAR
jgi:hypothetical protein